MREYSKVISLNKNSRGVYSIDPSIGCTSGMQGKKNGCYDDCYASRIARIYGYNFAKTIERDFINVNHLNKIKKQINKVKLPFIRMGTMGDPSENWEHTIKICEKLQYNNQLSFFNIKAKEIVIITKHWVNLSNEQLERLKLLNVCINTSVSVLDEKELFDNSFVQYERVKPYCRSILRLVSCDFNKDNKIGLEYFNRQQNVFDNYNVIDTVFRVSLNNQLVKDGIIHTHKTKFLGKNCNVSKVNKKTYFGKCDNCLEMCGVNM